VWHRTRRGGASATSSASTKLFHGGLRYLEYFDFRLVRDALIEREILLQAMPHISWPMRFVLPYHKDMQFDAETPTSKLLGRMMPWMKGRRPAWLLRFGLFLYDHLGGRKILPGTRTINLRKGPEGRPLDERFRRAYEYSDCWVNDARLVVLNACDAQAHGAHILTRCKVLSADREAGHWFVKTKDTETGEEQQHRARTLVNATGPWVGDIISGALGSTSKDRVRLVRGSHIVTRKLFDHDKAYLFQGEDGRIIFAIPYEGDFTLIGTTEASHEEADMQPVCAFSEQDYLIEFANTYFSYNIARSDIVWTYSGVRPLYDDGASSATAATREYILKLDDTDGVPVLNIFGGKLTTYRRLAENAVEKIGKHLGSSRQPWTANGTLPGGDFPVDGVKAQIKKLAAIYPFLNPTWAARLVRAYGTEAFTLLGDAQDQADLGQDFGATLTEREVLWLINKEFARCAEDVVWRRSKLGLQMSKAEVLALDKWMKKATSGDAMPDTVVT